MKKILFKITTVLLVMAVVFTSSASALTSSFSYSSAVEKKLFSTAKLKDYVKPSTPAFDKSKSSGYITTTKTRISYLKKMVKNNDYMSLYFREDLADTPVVFFTGEDMSAVTDWQSACQVFAASDKVNVLYQAQLHGNEPAAGEGALYFLQRIADDEEYAAKLAEHLNICVVPCANPDAAEINSRESRDGLNVNRDNLIVDSEYTLWLHNLYGALMPEVVLDSHECMSNLQVSPKATSDFFTDVYFAGTSSLNIDERINEWSSVLRDSGMKGCKNAGLRVSIYDSEITAVNNTVSRTYYGLYGSVSVLIESMGINMGKNHFGRRVYSHYKAVDSILKAVIKNKDEISQDVAEARRELSERGKDYDADNHFALEQKVSGNEYTTVTRDVFSAKTGSKIKTVKYKVRWHDEIVRSRSLPTAYVISKKAKNAALAAEKLQSSGIEYFELEAGSKIKASQFSGNGEKAKIIKGKDLTFSKGAYIIPMDQAGAKVIAACLEPDVTETLDYEGTFVQAGLLNAKYIYRYTKSNPRENLKEMTVGYEPPAAEDENTVDPAESEEPSVLTQ